MSGGFVSAVCGVCCIADRYCPDGLKSAPGGGYTTNGVGGGNLGLLNATRKSPFSKIPKITKRHLTITKYYYENTL